MNISIIFSTSPSLTKRAGTQITFALLCLRASSEISSSQQTAALIFWCLFAVIATPLALPQINIPNDVKGITQLALGYTHSCGLTATGVRCWGSNYYTQTEVPADRGRVALRDLGARAGGHVARADAARR